MMTNTNVRITSMKTTETYSETKLNHYSGRGFSFDIVLIVESSCRGNRARVERQHIDDGVDQIVARFDGWERGSEVLRWAAEVVEALEHHTARDAGDYDALTQLSKQLSRRS